MNTKKQHGVGMIEVLVASLIMSIGFLGLASLQITGLRFNMGANYRTHAAGLVDDMVDRINANAGAKLAGSYNSLNSSTITGTVPACISTSAGCNSASLATYDMLTWCVNFSDCTASTPVSVLPASSATVTRNNATGIFTVTVSWTEAADNNSNVKSVSVNFL